MDGFMLIMAILAALWLFCVGCFALVVMMDERHTAWIGDAENGRKEKRRQ